jgi:hypothetical protein
MTASLFVVLRESFLVENGTAFAAARRFRYSVEALGDPVAAFTDPDRAEAARLALDTEARHDLSPFLFANMEESLTSLSHDAFRAGVAATGLEPPVLVVTDDEWEHGTHWRRWWNALDPEPTPEQRAAVWTLCDRVVLYTVHEVPQEG